MTGVRQQLLAGLRAVLALTVLTGIFYPLAVTLVGQLAFEDEADGSLVRQDGDVVGSSLLGQSFTQPEYFHGRPSAAGAAAIGIEGADPHDPTQIASGASNLGPTNADFLDGVADAVAAYRDDNGLRDDTPCRSMPSPHRGRGWTPTSRWPMPACRRIGSPTSVTWTSTRSSPSSTTTPTDAPGLPRGARRERAAAQPGPRRRGEGSARAVA